MVVYKETDEWYIKWHQITTSKNELQQVVQRMATSDNEWHRVVQRMTTSSTTSDNEWYSKCIKLNFIEELLF